MKRDIPESLKSVVSNKVTIVKKFLDEFEKCIAKSNKINISKLLANLV